MKQTMKQTIKALVKRVPFIKALSEQVKKQGMFPAGHYYSPIPSREDVISYVKSRTTPASDLPGINLNEKRQREALVEYTGLYHELPFPEKQTTTHRYYYENGWFSYSDAIFLYCFLRHHKPKRIIEIGSGFSSAVMLDTIDGFFSKRPEVTFIEPYPDRLLSLLREGDRERVRLIDQKIQDVPLDIFFSLESGDLLFIDSRHVVKCGSDLQLLMFEILPRLRPGVFVHFHDVFYPFDYPSDWLIEGRYWNENYFLRAFLSYNSEWSIRFFNTYAHFKFGDLIGEKMPLCAKNPGGSLYIQRDRRS
jgi:predicted O-methyltransferase YrrM